jgi:hypothetical protein
VFLEISSDSRASNSAAYAADDRTARAGDGVADHCTTDTAYQRATDSLLRRRATCGDNASTQNSRDCYQSSHDGTLM